MPLSPVGDQQCSSLVSFEELLLSTVRQSLKPAKQSHRKPPGRGAEVLTKANALERLAEKTVPNHH